MKTEFLMVSESEHITKSYISYLHKSKSLFLVGIAIHYNATAQVFIDELCFSKTTTEDTVIRDISRTVVHELIHLCCFEAPEEQVIKMEESLCKDDMLGNTSVPFEPIGTLI